MGRALLFPPGGDVEAAILLARDGVQADLILGNTPLPALHALLDLPLHLRERLGEPVGQLLHHRDGFADLVLTDAKGVRWSARASYRADADGEPVRARSFCSFAIVAASGVVPALRLPTTSAIFRERRAERRATPWSRSARVRAASARTCPVSPRAGAPGDL